MATVSIIIPTFNRSKLLEECVNSLLAQTYSDIEIIVVDDGSADDTKATITSIAQKDHRVRYYPRPHLGAPAMRNFGLEKANGEYIGFFDSDDLWPPDYIETMVKTLKVKPDFDAAYSRLMLFNEGKILGQYGRAKTFPSGYLTNYLFSNNPYVMPSGVIFRRGVWNDIRWDEALKTNNQDLEVFLRISMKAKFVYVPDIYTLYRQIDNSITTSAAGKIMPYKIRVMERFYFQLGGNSRIPKRWAFRQISHQYRSLGMKHYRAGNRKAAITMLKMALCYLPFDLRLYINLFRAFLLRQGDDKMPDWKMPPELPSRPDEKCVFENELSSISEH